MPRTQPDATPSVNTSSKSAVKSTTSSPYKLLEDYPPFTGMSPAQHAKLAELCGPRWIDLLLHLPRAILDRSATPTVAEATVGERATILATVLKRPPLPPRHIKRPLSIDLSDGQNPIRAVFFNPGGWLERAFPVGEQVILSGKIESDNKGKKILHPDVWSAQKKDLNQIARPTPLYPATAGLGQGWLSRAIQQALYLAAQNPLPEWLPTTTSTLTHWPDFITAIQQVHNPQTEADILPQSPARCRLAFDELFANQLALTYARQTTRFLSGITHGSRSTLSEKLIAALPWPLTDDQSQVLEEIKQDLLTPRPMLRLVQGDVGAGKTLVAILALLQVMENGHQGVLMAPTEILATQHYENARRLLEPLGLTVGLLTGRLSAANKKRLKQHVREGFVNLLIGTHALVQEDVIFNKLGLVVIDEQHRFGVKQRIALSDHQTLPPDILVMTATPIPRTLALTAYGDMDISTIRQKPPGRTPITTVVMPDDRLPEIAHALKRVIEKNEQVYWVCPLVEESEDSDLAAATERFSDLEKVYGPENVGLLHGKLKSADKDAAMQAFKAGHTKILISTTVIEVGVDVPAATVIVIEHAERFGLSQLHQLRGRVGRGLQASRCILLYTAPLSFHGNQRLQALRDSEDGFYLAEKDLELRGPGEILGTRQSGQLASQLVDLFAHKDLIPLARQAADKVLETATSNSQRNALLALLRVFHKESAANLLRSG